MNVTKTPGLLTGWLRTLGNGWLAIVDTVLPIEGQPTCTSRLVVPAAAVSPDSFALRRRLGK
jgi:hypothetical protein